ncbi:hypothetical protein OT109_00010 [Phycisphaeraceae bacterium D3-23]
MSARLKSMEPMRFCRGLDRGRVDLADGEHRHGVEQREQHQPDRGRELEELVVDVRQRGRQRDQDAHDVENTHRDPFHAR